jgi:hypothetical protein
MRDWRFEVVRDDHGQPVPVRTHVAMMLEGTRTEAGDIEVRLLEPRFSARSIGQRLTSDAYAVDGERIQRVAVRYPPRGVWADARVLVVAEYDASGRVVRTGARTAQLLGVTVKAREHRRAQQMLQPFVYEAERATAQWRFPPASKGESGLRSVLIPVHFVGQDRPRTDLRHWAPAVSIHALEQDWAQPENFRTELALQTVPDDDASFGLLRLLSAVDGSLL